jgi:cyclophilin family peptidyl-prolyl cis-trans isomerase
MKNMFSYFITSLLLLAFGQSYAESQPDQDLVKTYLTNKVDHESYGAIKLVKFKKAEGARRTAGGQGWYDMHFSITIQPTRYIWKAGRTCWYDFDVYTAKPAGWDEHINGGTIAYAANQTIKLTGVAQCLQMGEKWVVDRVSFTEAGAPAASANAAPETWRDTPGLYAEIATAKGTVVCSLEYKKAPVTVGNFVALCQGLQANSGRALGQPFYDGIIFHRVIANFMIQGGDANASKVGTSATYTFKDEFDPSLKLDAPGVLAMANAGPGTNQTQFFITHVATNWLTGKHTVFGHVVMGQPVVNAIAQGDAITSIRIIRIGREAEAFDALQSFGKK